MPNDPPQNTPEIDSSTAAELIGGMLNQRGVDYAFGGAIALGYWAEPRGTLDVDLTLFLDPADRQSIVDLLVALGCRFDQKDVERLLAEHGFCRATFHGVPIDVFLPTFGFYELARQRRVRVPLGDESVLVWSAETLAVFKMMFFRSKDRVDCEGLLRDGAGRFDRDWVRARLVEIFGPRDPRLPAWDELIAQCPEFPSSSAGPSDASGSVRTPIPPG